MLITAPFGVTEKLTAPILTGSLCTSEKSTDVVSSLAIVTVLLADRLPLRTLTVCVPTSASTPINLRYPCPAVTFTEYTFSPTPLITSLSWSTSCAILIRSSPESTTV